MFHSKLSVLYLERGLGKLIDLHSISFSSESKNNWAYSDAAKTLFSQVKILFDIKEYLDPLTTELCSVLDDIATLYTLKEIPVRSIDSCET